MMTDAMTIAELGSRLEAYLQQIVSSPVKIANLVRLTGGASRDTWIFDAEIATGPEAGKLALVMRRDWGGVIQPEALSRGQEFQVLSAIWNAGVLVPRPRWSCEDPKVLDLPFFIMDRIEGESVGSRVVRAPQLAEARKALPEQMGRQLARIHAVEPGTAGLTFLPAPGVAGGPAQRALALGRRQLDEAEEAHPALEWGFRWLEKNAPVCRNPVLAHGDFRLGNVMVGPEGLRAIFDWEFSHIGDPAEDLAWPSVRSWRFGQDKLKFGGVGDPEEFYRAYEEAGGRPVDRSAVRFWEIIGNLRWAVGCLAQARRHLTKQAPSVELASLGRRSAEMEAELIDLIEAEMKK